jgi:hypothetical protein
MYVLTLVTILMHPDTQWPEVRVDYEVLESESD